MRIFLDDVDYRQFVHLLSDIVEDFEIECWNAGSIRVGPSLPFVSALSMLRQFGNEEPEILQARFANYVLSATGADLEDRIRSPEGIVGDAAFKKSLVSLNNDILDTSHRASADQDRGVSATV